MLCIRFMWFFIKLIIVIVILVFFFKCTDSVFTQLKSCNIQQLFRINADGIRTSLRFRNSASATTFFLPFK